MAKITVDLESFKQAAESFRDEILLIPVVGLKETLDNMSRRSGVHGILNVGAISADGEFGTYNADRVTANGAQLEVRALQTYLDSMITKFEPDKVAQTVISNLEAVDGDLKNTNISKLVLAALIKSASKKLNAAIWKAQYQAGGATSDKMFDGFDTITDKEIAAGKISVENKNLVKYNKKISDTNAVDIFKKIYRAADPVLKETECNIFVDPDLLAAYREHYATLHGSVVYNDKYEQTALEGTGGKWKFVPLTNKAGSKYITIAPKENMLIGYDTENPDTHLLVGQYEPFRLTFSAAIWFGVQFASIDPTQLLIAKYAEPAKEDTSEE